MGEVLAYVAILFSSLRRELCRNLFRVDEHEGNAAGDRATIHPRVIGALLHQHIAWRKMHLILVEQHVDLTFENDRVVDAACAMHSGMARAAMIAHAHLSQDRLPRTRAALGGKSTTRRMLPFGGGGTPISRAARSALPEISAGVSSVTHTSVETSPDACRSFWFGAALSKRSTARPSRWPVTTRRTGFIPASRPRRAARRRTCRSPGAGWRRSPPACRR